VSTVSDSFSVRPVGVIRSELAERKGAPRQGEEDAPDAWLEIHPWAKDCTLGISVGDRLDILTWLHEGRRDTMRVYPRGDRGLVGVFNTRSPDRPNPIGIHPVTVLEIDGDRMKIGPIEAIDGTPVVDIKQERCPK
jgi:tRNA-Thr(GGU) m(6)t(6)A37 methyltransferase TsaA